VKSLTKYWKKLPHPLRWIVVATVGFTLLIVGLVLLVLPGPGIPLILIGLAILASEFAWAEYLLNRTKKQIQKVSKRVHKK
jgi:uncharacterized protein (TIGR02611 family)